MLAHLDSLVFGCSFGCCDQSSRSCVNHKSRREARVSVLTGLAIGMGKGITTRHDKTIKLSYVLDETQVFLDDVAVMGCVHRVHPVRNQGAGDLIRSYTPVCSIPKFMTTVVWSHVGDLSSARIRTYDSLKSWWCLQTRFRFRPLDTSTLDVCVCMGSHSPVRKTTYSPCTHFMNPARVEIL